MPKFSFLGFEANFTKKKKQNLTKSYQTIDDNIFGRMFQKDVWTMDDFALFYEKSPDILSALTKWENSIYTEGHKINSLKESEQEIEQSLQDKIDLVFKPISQEVDSIRVWYKESVFHRKILGDAYILLKINILGELAGGRALDPRTIEIKTDKYGKVLYYEQSSSDNLQTKLRFPPWQIIHFKEGHNLKNAVMGSSPLNRLSLIIKASDEATKTMLATYLNNNAPRNLFIGNHELIASMTARDNFDELMDKINKQLQGSDNAGKSVMIPALSDVKPVQQALTDETLLKAKDKFRGIVAQVYGMSSLLLGDESGSTFANGEEATMNFNREIIPYEQVDQEIITKRFLWLIDPRLVNYEFVFNDKPLRKKNEIEQAQINMVKAGIKTPLEARSKLGLNNKEFEDLPNANTLMVTNNIIPLEDAGIEPAEPEEDNKDDKKNKND